jgi:hypothetical protein
MLFTIEATQSMDPATTAIHYLPSHMSIAAVAHLPRHRQ